MPIVIWINTTERKNRAWYRLPIERLYDKEEQSKWKSYQRTQNSKNIKSSASIFHPESPASNAIVAVGQKKAITHKNQKTKSSDGNSCIG